MRLWRIVQRKHALDRLGAGAAKFGGRWNPIGQPAIYCSNSVALRALEKFVRVEGGQLPPLVLVAVDFPAHGDIFTPAMADLPQGWDDMPASASAQAYGGAWLATCAALAMQVPSAIVPEEANTILNPHHPDIAQVRMSIVRPFSFDNRLYKPA